jgi:hypothetical protein
MERKRLHSFITMPHFLLIGRLTLSLSLSDSNIYKIQIRLKKRGRVNGKEDGGW